MFICRSSKPLHQLENHEFNDLFLLNSTNVYIGSWTDYIYIQTNCAVHSLWHNTCNFLHIYPSLILWVKINCYPHTIPSGAVISQHLLMDGSYGSVPNPGDVKNVLVSMFVHSVGVQNYRTIITLMLMLM